MHLIPQVKAQEDVAAVVRNLKPLALQRQGEEVDRAFINGTLGVEREWCKRVRDLGVLVGVGTHNPEVIETIEEQGWDVDFYAGCVYHRTRTEAEWKLALNGEMLEMPREIYLQSDPARMYKVIRQTTKTCFAFKILAAGRIAPDGIEGAFRTAFQSIKPNDGIFVGMYPRMKDEVKENAEIGGRYLLHAQPCIPQQRAVGCTSQNLCLLTRPGNAQCGSKYLSGGRLFERFIVHKLQHGGAHLLKCLGSQLQLSRQHPRGDDSTDGDTAVHSLQRDVPCLPHRPDRLDGPRIVSCLR